MPLHEEPHFLGELDGVYVNSSVLVLSKSTTKLA
jgi:hypothetical protein